MRDEKNRDRWGRMASHPRHVGAPEAISDPSEALSALGSPPSTLRPLLSALLTFQDSYHG